MTDDAIKAGSQTAFERATRRILAYSLLLLLGIGVILGAVLWKDRQDRLVDGARLAASLADGMAREVTREFTYIERILKGVVSDWHRFQRDAPEHAEPLMLYRLESIVARYSVLSDIALDVDLPADIEANSASQPQRENSEHLQVGPPQHSDRSGWTLPIAFPILDAPPGTPRWVTARLGIDALRPIVTEPDLGDDGMANVVHRSGRMIQRSRDQARFVDTDLAETRLFRTHVASRPSGVFEQSSPLDASVRITAYRALEDYPLVVAAGVGRREVLSGWSTFVATVVSLGAILAGFWLVLMRALLRSRTRQRRVIESLGATAAQLLEAHRVAGLGEWTWQLDTGLVTWSEEIFRVHGLPPSPDPFRLESITPMLHPEDQPRLEERFRNMLADGEPVDMEYRIVRPDGDVRTIYARGQWLNRTRGERLLRGTQQDITELARTREELRQAQHEYRFLFEQNPLPMWVFDLETLRFLAVNDAAITHYGYARDEWLGMTLADIRPATDRAALLEAVNAPDRDAYAGHVWTHVRKDGEAIRVATFGRDMHFEGRAARMVLAEDVTERERNEERFKLIARATSDAVWDWDLVTGVTWRSDNVYALFGYSPGEFGATLGAWGELLHPDDRERVLASVWHGIESGADDWEAEYRLLRKDGTYVNVLDRSFILRDEHGRALRAVGGMLDVTAQHQAEDDLRLLRRAVEASDSGIVIADARTPGLPLVYANPAFERITGYTRDEVIGRNCDFLQGAENDQPEISAITQAIAEQREVRVLLRNYRKNGELFWNDFYLAPVRDDAGALTHFVGIQSDVTERQRILEQLAYRATFDELTGLPNRQLLSDRLQQAVHNAKRFSRGVGVLFVDLDDFKLINDSLGHSAGDEALRGVAQRLGAAIRGTDTLGRFGGDEFVVILTEQADEDGVGRVIERITAALAQPIAIAGVPHYVNASIGYAQFPDGGEDAETLLRHADTAMYQAKQQGRNRAVAYRSDFDAGISERLHLVSALRDALQRDEFCLHFQPLFDRDRVAVAVEALVRWQHPERGLLAPGHFIGVCEDSGLIVPLGRWVLREAARHYAGFAAAGLGHLRVAVNVSSAQFTQDLYADVAAVVEEFGLPEGVLEIELTESLLMTNPERAIETILRLSTLGVSLSVDDFGTGYSSLAYLKRLPLQRLKIDRSFVEDLGVDEDDAEICASIIGLAHSLRLTTVAEGVETEEQFEWLRACECDEMQGFLLARPAPFDEILPKLLAHRDPISVRHPRESGDPATSNKNPGGTG